MDTTHTSHTDHGPRKATPSDRPILIALPTKIHAMWGHLSIPAVALLSSR